MKEERKSNVPVNVEDLKSPQKISNKDNFNRSLYSPAVYAVIELSKRGGSHLSSGGFK